MATFIYDMNKNREGDNLQFRLRRRRRRRRRREREMKEKILFLSFPLRRTKSPAPTSICKLKLFLFLLLACAIASWSTFSAPRTISTKTLIPSRQSQPNSRQNPSSPPKLEASNHPDSRNSLARLPYHDWDLFALDFEEMLKNLKIFVYPDVSDESSTFSRVFLPHPDPLNPKLGNYFSEHMFKINLLRSSLLTSDPEEAHFFFMPFSINSLRNDPRVRSEASIADFVADYALRIGKQFRFWNATKGSDHFYVCCHSVGRDAASKHRDLQSNALQVACSSSYFQRLYVPHKDVAMPQVWPRTQEKIINPPDARNRLVFFAGRAQNSHVREELIALWENDTSMDIFSGHPPFPYEEGFRRSKFCLHVKGYEVNSARVSDALHYGCIPVMVSNYYDLPFADVLDWSKFSLILTHQDVPSLKQILLSIPREMYLNMYSNLCKVRKHFRWHMTPRGYDSFHMVAYQLWVRRGMLRLSS